MEKLREIYVFVCFALGVVALILCVFQGWSGKIGSASALGAAFVICGVFLFLSQIKTFKVWEVQVELRSTLVIVLHNGEQEIERELARPADVLRVALMMLARRGRLESGDVLKVMAPN